MTARIGLIVPSSNPTIEEFLPLVAPVLDVSFLVTRIRVRRIATDEDSDAQFDVESLSAAASLLADAEVALVSWAGTAGFWLGPDREQTALDAVGVQVGMPVLSSRMAMMSALAQADGRGLGVLTPYRSAVHDRVLATLAAAGYDITADVALGLERNRDFADVPGDVVAEHLRELGGSGAVASALVCTNVLGTLQQLKPDRVLVVDSVLATLWDAARRAGATTLPYRDCYRAVLDAGTDPKEPR